MDTDDPKRPTSRKRRASKPAKRARTARSRGPGQDDTVAAGAARPRGDSTFPIVGLGASAGGLEALEDFLKHVPERSGMAFVVVQHLDPTHKGMLVELSQRATTMPVLQAKDDRSGSPRISAAP